MPPPGSVEDAVMPTAVPLAAPSTTAFVALLASVGVDHARAHIEHTYDRPAGDRLVRALLAAVLPYPQRFRLALAGVALARPFAPLIGLLPQIGPRLRAMIELAPKTKPAPRAETPVVSGPRRGRVVILDGLDEGDIVVADPPDSLEIGMKVKS